MNPFLLPLTRWSCHLDTVACQHWFFVPDKPSLLQLYQQDEHCAVPVFFRHQAKNRCCCLRIRKSFFSGDNWSCETRQTESRMKNKDEKIAQNRTFTVVCSFAVNRISGVNKRSGGLSLEQNRFQLQTGSICLNFMNNFLVLLFIRVRKINCHNAVNGLSQKDYNILT